MKKIFILLLFAQNLSICLGQSVELHMKNGDVRSFKIEDVDFINFTEEDEDVVDPVYFGDHYLAEYRQSFIAYFGQVHPNHTWGFNFATTRSGTEGRKYRVIAEDMVSNDFDFNDVVFDVEDVGDGIKITVQAVGTTIPMSIFGQEVHELFGLPTDQMVNTTGANIQPPVSFTVNAPFEHVRVESYVDGVNALVLEVITGIPTPMIAVAPDFEWCVERQSISAKYSSFPQWVQDPSVKWYDSQGTSVIIDVTLGE